MPSRNHCKEVSHRLKLCTINDAALELRAISFKGHDYNYSLITEAYYAPAHLNCLLVTIGNHAMQLTWTAATGDVESFQQRVHQAALA